MKKIKINTITGATLEKPLITAFKGNNGNYVVLDNEMNGSMGLPIILVCKLDDNKLVKINDQNEWNTVKENLKSIIAGGQMEYIKIDDIMAADEIFYTQLTLPVVSFDTLKNNYKIEEDNNANNTASIFDINPMSTDIGPTSLNGVNNTQPTPGMNPNVNMNTGIPVNAGIPPMPNGPVNNIPETNIQAPVMDLGLNNVNPISQAPSPVSNVAPVSPIEPQVSMTPSGMEPLPNNINVGTNNANIVNTTNDTNSSKGTNTLNAPLDVAPHLEEQINNIVNGPIPNGPQVTSEPNPMPVSPSVPTSNIGLSTDLFKDQKEAFMQACENMFDALVQKFEKELEKR